MSHNLTLSGYSLYQTRTNDTFDILAAGDRYQIADEYFRRYVFTKFPAPLQGKDARNPYLVGGRERDVAEVEAEAENLRAYLRANPDARWGSV